MAFLDWLNRIDTQWLMAINGWNSSYFDYFFTLFTNKQIWYPLYVLLLYVIVRRYKLQSLWVIIFLALAIVICDQGSGIVKSLTERLRPTHQPMLNGLLNIPANKGGLYGYFSAHAANSFALAFLLGFLSRRKRIWVFFILWAILTSYSRIYLAVHYPFDVITGALFGILVAWGIYKLLLFFDFHLQRKQLSKKEGWLPEHTQPIMIALIFITITVAIASNLIGKYF